MGNPNSKSSFKNSLNNEFNFVNSDSFIKNGDDPIPEDNDRDNNVLTKFVWSYGGMSVFLTGSFNNWKKKIPMERNGEQFSVTLLLPRSIHYYKFIVDGQWRFSPEHPTIPDSNGHINNLIDTSKFQAIKFHLNGAVRNDESGQITEKMENNAKNKKQSKKILGVAPPLPPYFQYCAFLEKDINYADPKKQVNWSEGYQNIESQLSDEEIHQLFTTSHGLKAPSHVQLGHIIRSQTQLYDTIGVTQRCQQKYTTYRHFKIN